MADGFKYDVFLSHSSQDDTFVRGLQQVLGLHGVSAWIDSRELLPGGLLDPDIAKAINDAAAYAVVVSPKSLQSRWVGKELRHALDVQKQRGRERFPVIPLSLNGARLGVLEEFFGEEPVYVPVSSDAGGMDAALNAILVALGKNLPGDALPMPEPKAELPEEERVPEPADLKSYGGEAARSFDAAIHTLVDGNEEERAAVLTQIMAASTLDRPALAARLCSEIQGRFSPENEREFASAVRDPKAIPSIRSWMLSCLIWAEPLASENQSLILRHLNESYEPARNVRFWTLSGLYQRKVPYLPEAIEATLSDSAPEVRALAHAVRTPASARVIEEFRAELLPADFDRAWPVLRVLRIVPVVTLVPDVCATLLKTPVGSTLAYDALYALTQPEVAHAAASLLSKEPGVAAFVTRVLREARGSNANAVRNFSFVLAAFEPAAVDRALAEARLDSETTEIAASVSTNLRELRRRADGHELVVAGYASDANDTRVDDLDIEEDVQTLAAVMLAKKVMPPLAIGLFGDWGSGKSYFMASMQNAAKELAARAKTSPDSSFCSDIVSIEFNAWHYVDTNLWASLVSHILQRLAAYVTPQLSVEEQEKKLLSELGSAKALVDEAQAEKTATQAVIVERQEELQTLAAARRRKEVKLEDLRASDLRRLLDGNTKVKEEIQTALTDVGVPAVMQSISDLSQVLLETYSLRGRAAALFLAVLKQRLVLTLVGVALVGIPALGWALGAFTESRASTMLTMLSTQVVAMLMGVVGVLRRGVFQARRNLERLETAKRQVDDLIAEKRATPTPEEQELQKEIAGLAAKELAAAKRLDAAAQRVLELEDRIRSVQEGRSLARFLTERTRSEDYRKHLGLISTIRQDFESLGERLAAPAKDGTQRVDRIILYIDDLDRCPVDKVIDVLHAVHLLLAYPLFVVVVGVDPRWLLHSLGTTYSAFRDRDAPDGTTANGWRTTPQNYLEKIFQIPFTLRPMTDTGYAAMMKRLLIPPAATNTPITHNMSPATPGAGERPDGTAPPLATISQEPPSLQAQTGQPQEPQSLASPAPVRRKFHVNEQALTIRAWETSYAERLFPLIPTPRAAKRFSNIYRLLKAPLAAANLPSFEGTTQLSGEFQVPMLLLAIVIGAPTEAVTLFPSLRAAALQGQDFVAFLEQPSGVNDPPGAQALRAKLHPLVTATGFPRLADLLLEWLPRVSRFSFELAGIVPPLHAQVPTAHRAYAPVT